MPGFCQGLLTRLGRRLTLACTLFLPLVLSPQILQAAIDPDLLHGLEARAIGPAAVSGRIAAIDVDNSNTNLIVVGVATGGVWISDNGGLTWDPVFDDEDVASIGAVAINQDNPDIIWVGTGEGNTRNSTSIGGGMYKSIDGGKTWNKVGLAGTERINRIALHPHNPDIAYAAALGTLWGENTERGIYRTTDGGANWERILYVNERTGGTDVKIDPFNPQKIYASMWQHRRWPWFFKSGGPGSGMYISWDGGQTWREKTHDDGLPAGELGRITFSPSAAEPGRVYALVEAEESALIRSDDGGESWKIVNQEHDIAVRPFYYTDIAADPQNPERIYNIYTQLSVSIDGGKTFEENPVVQCCAPSNTIHIDNHAFWINPADPKHLVLGNDGGIAISRDRGKTWRFVRNLPLSQFYHVAVDNDHPYNVYGGLQDNGSWRGPAELWENAGIRNLHWQEVGFGDGFDTLPDPHNSRQGYVMSQGGYLSRWNLDTGEQRLIRPDPQPADADLRFNWDAALAQDPFDGATIYYGSQFVHKSTDRGASWTVISPDLTSNDPDMQTFRQSGGLTPDVTAAENYTTLVTIAPSPHEQGTLWVGSDDGRIHITRNGGEDWNRIDTRARGLKAGAWVPMITPSPHDPGTAFVVIDDHRRSDMKPYVYRVENYGQRWTSIVTDEVRGYALSILQDAVDPRLLFLGTEFGLFISRDGGSSWFQFRAGVPTVSVMDMAIQQRETDLVLGTHGRSIYVIDDYSGLRNLTEQDLQQRLAILSVTDGQQYDPNDTPSTRFTGSGEFRANNEPYGVLVTYVASGDDLPHPDAERERARKAVRAERLEGFAETTDENGNSKPGKDEIKVNVVVSDLQGNEIRHFSRPVKQGVNRFNWDLSHNGVRPLPGSEPEEKDTDLPAGPEVPPGQYQLTISLESPDGNSVNAMQTVTVLADPRSPVTAEARMSNYRSMLDLQLLEERAVTAVENIERSRADLKTVERLLVNDSEKEPDTTPGSLYSRARELSTQLDTLEQRFRVPPNTRGHTYDDDKVVNMIGMAQYYTGSTMDSPTPAAGVYTQLARDALQAAESDLRRFVDGPLAEFRKALQDAGVGLLLPAGSSTGDA